MDSQDGTGNYGNGIGATFDLIMISETAIQVFYENEIQPLPPFLSLHCEKTSKLQLLEAYLEPYQRSMMELFCESSSRNSTVNQFHKPAPSQIFDKVLNTPPITVGLTKNQMEKQQSSFYEHWLSFRVGLAILKLVYGTLSQVC